MSAAARSLPLPYAEPANDAPRFVTLQQLAGLRGLPNARSAKAWCKRHQVPIRRDGRYNWVDANHVDAAIARIPATTVGQTEPAAPTVASWVSTITDRR